MALTNQKVTDLTEKTTAPADSWLHFVDKSDVSQDSSGSSYKISKSSFLKEIKGASRFSISEIRALSSLTPIEYFYTTDKGQEGNWYYDATDTTSVDNTGTVLVTADGKRIKRVFDGKVNVKWFGAKGDGISDDTYAFNAAILSLGVNGGTVSIPDGNWVVTTVINITTPIKIIGTSFANTKIKSSVNGYTFVIQGVSSVSLLTGNVISDLTIDGGVSIGSTSGIYAQYCYNLFFNQVKYKNVTQAIELITVEFAMVDYQYLNGVNAGISFFDCIDVRFTNSFGFGSKYTMLFGVKISSKCDGIKVDTVNIVNADKSLVIENNLGGSGNHPQSILISNSDFGDGNWGLYLTGGFAVSMVNVQVVTNVFDGIFLSNAGSYKFTNVSASNNGQNGITIFNTKNAVFTNCKFAYSSKSITTTYDGVAITGNSDNLRFISCVFGSEAYASIADGEKQRYGISNSNSANDVRLVGCIEGFNLTGYKNDPNNKLKIDNQKIVLGTSTDSGEMLQIYGKSKFSNAIDAVQADFRSNQAGAVVARVVNDSASSSASSSYQSVNNTSDIASIGIFSSAASSTYAKNGFITATWDLLLFAGGNEVMRLIKATKNVLIGTTTDISSSILTISSTTKGVLLPRMSTAQRDAITSPIEGLEIYNLSNKAKEFYDGTVWKTIATIV
jgi:hypothetical protein